MEDGPPGIPELRPVPAPVAVSVVIPPHALLTHRVALHVGLIRTQRTPAPPAIRMIMPPMWIINTGLSVGPFRRSETQVKNNALAFQLRLPP